MENDLLPTMDVANFYGIATSLELGQRKYVRTDVVADCVAEAVRENHFLVKYDKTTAPMIDAAVLRNIGYKDDEELQRTVSTRCARASTSSCSTWTASR